LKPSDVAITPDGDFAYVSNFGAPIVSIRSPTQWSPPSPRGPHRSAPPPRQRVRFRTSMPTWQTATTPRSA